MLSLKSLETEARKFSAVASGSATDRGPLADFWYKALGQDFEVGIEVTEEAAMRIITVAACIRLIAETMHTIPFRPYREEADGDNLPLTNHWLADRLRSRANQWQTPGQFRETMFTHCLMRGNAYAFQKWNERGEIEAYIPLDGRCVTVVQEKDGRLTYKYRKQGWQNPMYFMQEEIFHLRGFSTDGVRGITPIQEFRSAIGTLGTVEKFAGRLFTNFARPGGVLISKTALRPEKREELKKQWEETYGGVDNAHRVAVLEGDMTWNQTSMTPQDSQFIATRKMNITECCNIYRVPPYMLGQMESMKYNNIESVGRDFVTRTLSIWATRFEQAIVFAAAPALDDSIVVRGDFDQLLRGDTLQFTQALVAQVQNGIRTSNEARHKLDLNKMEGGDVLRMQKQMASLEDQPDTAVNSGNSGNDENNEDDTNA